MSKAGCWGGVLTVSHGAMAASIQEGWSCGVAMRQGCSAIWRGVTGSSGPCGGEGIARILMGSQWRSQAVRAYRTAVMMC